MRAEPFSGRVLDRHRIVTLFVPQVTRTRTEMNPVKAAFLSFAMLSAIALCGVGIYAADAASGRAVVDGYGITSFAR